MGIWNHIKKKDSQSSLKEFDDEYIWCMEQGEKIANES